VTYDNDGRFPDAAAVQTRYPDTRRRSGSDRDAWPWLDATVQHQCGPDEWLVTIEDRRVAELEDGTPYPRAPRMTSCCFRCASATQASCASPGGPW
jgi:hypothetical protein